MASINGKIDVGLIDGVINDIGFVNFSGAWIGIPRAAADPSPSTTTIPVGATYFNTGDNSLRIWNGSTWTVH